MQTQDNPNFWKGGQSRIFVQVGIGEALQYMGCAQLEGLSQDQGEPEPVYCPDPNQRESWIIVDQVKRAPSLATADLSQKADRYLRDVWWRLKRTKCPFKIHVVNGLCADPSDSTTFDSKVLMDHNLITSFGLDGTLNPSSGDDNAVEMITVPVSTRNFYEVLLMAFAQVADATVLAEVLDGLYFDVISCGDCGLPSDGTNRLYFLASANTGSPGLSSQIVYTINGSTWATLDIPVLGGLSGNRVVAMGTKLIVLSQAYGGYVWIEFDDLNAGLTSGWTGVTSGFVATKAPRAGWSKSSYETFIAAAGGYIYLLETAGSAPSRILTDGSITTQDLSDIDGVGTVNVAVGNSNAMLVTTNNGETYSAVTGPAVGFDLTCVSVINRYIWFVGADNGKLYRTVDGGVTWSQVQIGTFSIINHVRFFDENIGYVAVEVGGASRVYRTTDGGYRWDYTKSLKNLPTAQRINRIVANPYNPNVIAVGGRKTVGGDGLIAIAE